jgi:glycerol-3-phosphate dehydrogenase subunit C
VANISYLPTDGLSYDPTEPKYWEKPALDQEIERVFEVCHGCRMCFKYCDSFKDLFQFVDAHDGDVRKVTFDETKHVMDACFQCKLCEVECPYTPNEGHEFQLDFPKLVARYRAQHEREHGHTLSNTALGDPDLSGAAARASLGMANVMNRVQAHRWFLEKVLDIHRDKLLPDFAGKTFEAEARERGVAFDWRDAEVVLFQTCYVQHQEPHIGHDTLKVLDANGVQATCARGLNCCGMPAWEYGNLELLRKKAKHNLDVLMPFVERGAKVLAINPTCSMMLRKEYPELLEGEDRARAEQLSEAVMDVGEYLWSIRREDRFNTAIKSKPQGDFAYHAPCHLRAQRVGFKGRDAIKKITGMKPKSVIECCGHNGTYAMTTAGFEPSQKYGRKAFEGMAEADQETWVTDCPLAAIQFQQHAGVKPMHPMTVLARAYEADGFGPGSSVEEEE